MEVYGVEVELRLSSTSSLDVGGVNLMHQVSLPPGKNHPYIMNKGTAGLHIRPGSFGKREEITCPFGRKSRTERTSWKEWSYKRLR